MFPFFSIISLRILLYVFLSYSSAPKILIFHFHPTLYPPKNKTTSKQANLKTNKLSNTICAAFALTNVWASTAVQSSYQGKHPFRQSIPRPSTASSQQQFFLADGGSFCIPFPLCRDLVWLEFIQVLSILWTLLLVHMCTNSAMSREHCFPCSHLLPLALRLFLPSLPF